LQVAGQVTNAEASLGPNQQANLQQLLQSRQQQTVPPLLPWLQQLQSLACQQWQQPQQQRGKEKDKGRGGEEGLTCVVTVQRAQLMEQSGQQLALLLDQGRSVSGLHFLYREKAGTQFALGVARADERLARRADHQHEGLRHGQKRWGRARADWVVLVPQVDLLAG
jgi:hypothetical protein